MGCKAPRNRLVQEEVEVAEAELEATQALEKHLVITPKECKNVLLDAARAVEEAERALNLVQQCQRVTE